MEKAAIRKWGTDSTAVEMVLRKSFLDFIRDGRGVVCLHYAIAANAHWPEFAELLGATFTGHPWTEEVGVTVEEPDHPLVAAFGGQDFRLADEIYRCSSSTWTRFSSPPAIWKCPPRRVSLPAMSIHPATQQYAQGYGDRYVSRHGSRRPVRGAARAFSAAATCT
jgi:hypothetical protein